MKANEFITEGTELIINGDDNAFAKRTSLGRGNGTALRMFVTKDEWEVIKDMQANTETAEYDIATAEMIVKDMVSKGSKLVWKTAADFNADARELENHRFHTDPDSGVDFSNAISQYRDKAKSVSKSSIKPIK